MNLLQLLPLDSQVLIYINKYNLAQNAETCYVQVINGHTYYVDVYGNGQTQALAISVEAFNNWLSISELQLITNKAKEIEYEDNPAYDQPVA